jgi:D-glycero-alpha-D-manno-heptose-7-phosphate kinase
MIISRSPLRVSLGGGGTDLPSYYREHGGFLIAGAIDKYVYVTFQETFVPQILIRYSQIERVSSCKDLKHPIIREALLLHEIFAKNIEITALADIPAGTGLGSSGSFATALLKAIYKYKMEFISPKDLAEEACHIELNILKEPIGKQDQYIASYGGLSVFEFCTNDEVKIRPLKISRETFHLMHDNLLLFSTGVIRSASAILKEQDDKTKGKDRAMVDSLHYIKDLGYRSCEAIESGNLGKFGELMNEHWLHKKKRSQNMSNASIDRWYDVAVENGAVGGKLIGAGGGGFLMFYTERPADLRRAMGLEGLMELRFGFDFEGTKLLV